jgi:glycosyltransferase involved in cell wall biosynthesis
MTFSIVIPVFNGEKYLEEAILSALNQTRKADEVIIHDDNSTDTTKEICDRYKSKVIYYRNDNGPSGCVNGWNCSIKLAKSDYISILHQDDVLHEKFIEESEKILKVNSGILHLFSVSNYIDEYDKIIAEWEVYDTDLLQYKVFQGNEYASAYQKSYGHLIHIHRCPGVITHRSIFFDQNCWYNESAGHIADDDFFYRVGQFTNVIGILNPLASFRIHSESETGKVKDIELIRRLARDYVFQVKHWQNSHFLNKENRMYFEYWAMKYLLRLVMYNLKLKDKCLSQELKYLFNEFKNIEFSRNVKINKLKLFVVIFLNKFF